MTLDYVALSIATLGFLSVVGLIDLLRRRRAGQHLIAIVMSVLLLALIAALAIARPVIDPVGVTAISAVALTAATLGGGTGARALLAAAGVHDAATAKLPGSAWIGVIERLAFTTALLLNLSDVAAILLGVKALGQYSAGSKNRISAARVLGTLGSVAWALGCFAVVAIVRASSRAG